jgi:hypothetical protein
LVVLKGLDIRSRCGWNGIIQRVDVTVVGKHREASRLKIVPAVVGEDFAEVGAGMESDEILGLNDINAVVVL